VALRVDDVAPNGYAVDRANVRQRKTGRPVRFELTEVTRQVLDDYLRASGRKLGQCLFPGRRGPDQSITTRQYARLASRWISGIEHEVDARRFWDAMRDRLEEFSLSLHPDKTRLIEFGRHAAARRAQRGLGKPETFKFLGFLFICGRSRKGKFQLKRKSRRDRMRAKLREIKEQLRPHQLATILMLGL
jgi:hypothetical protein